MGIFCGGSGFCVWKEHDTTIPEPKEKGVSLSDALPSSVNVRHLIDDPKEILVFAKQVNQSSKRSAKELRQSLLRRADDEEYAEIPWVPTSHSPIDLGSPGSPLILQDKTSVSMGGLCSMSPGVGSNDLGPRGGHARQPSGPIGGPDPSEPSVQTRPPEMYSRVSTGGLMSMSPAPENPPLLSPPSTDNGPLRSPEFSRQPKLLVRSPSSQGPLRSPELPKGLRSPPSNGPLRSPEMLPNGRLMDPPSTGPLRSPELNYHPPVQPNRPPGPLRSPEYPDLRRLPQDQLPSNPRTAPANSGRDSTRTPSHSRKRPMTGLPDWASSTPSYSRQQNPTTSRSHSRQRPIAGLSKIPPILEEPGHSFDGPHHVKESSLTKAAASVVLLQHEEPSQAVEIDYGDQPLSRGNVMT